MRSPESRAQFKCAEGRLSGAFRRLGEIAKLREPVPVNLECRELI